MYEHVLTWVATTPWAILPEKLAVMMEVLAVHARGGKFSADEIAARIGDRRPSAAMTSGGVAVLPLHGIISQRADMMSESSGGTSTEGFTRAFRAAVADPDVGAIVIDVDSPGGSVPGVDELSAEIFRARGQKPVTAVANSLAASAAYWIASAADELVVAPSGEVGSIGVFTAHQDLSRALDSAGITTTLIGAGKYKTEASPYAPLSVDARAAIQSRVDDYYGMFTRAVARNRGVSVDDVRGGFGEGRVVGARDAVRQRMADRIGTLDAVIGKYASGHVGRGSRSALVGTSDLLAGPIKPMKSPRIASRDEPWDAGEVEKSLPEDRREWLKVYAWYDDTAPDPDHDGLPEAKSAWKLPHAKADGTLVPRGLYAAAQRLDGTQIPDGDRSGVRAHLEFHYHELGEKAPWEQASADLDFRRRRSRMLRM